MVKADHIGLWEARPGQAAGCPGHPNLTVLYQSQATTPAFYRSHLSFHQRSRHLSLGNSSHNFAFRHLNAHSSTRHIEFFPGCRICHGMKSKLQFVPLHRFAIHHSYIILLIGNVIIAEIRTLIIIILLIAIIVGGSFISTDECF